MKVLVTGAAGYIGSVLVPMLLERGYQVTALDNFMYGQDSLAASCIDPNLSIVRGDARDDRLVRSLCRKADAIIPLAAIVGAPACDSDQIAAASTNVGGIEIIARKAKLSRDQAVLLPVTNSGYGRSKEICDEFTNMNPLSVYGQNKAEAEYALFRYHETAASFRLATAFGMSPRMRLDLLVNDFVYRAVTDKAIVLFESHFKRNFIHVRDIARVFLHGIDNIDSMKGKPYNVGLSDANLSKRELCERIQQHVPGFVFVESEIGKDPDQRDYVVSNARIEATGFRPKISLDDGIAELIKGYQMIRRTQYGNA